MPKLQLRYALVYEAGLRRWRAGEHTRRSAGGARASLTLGTQIQTKMTYQDETSCNVIINALGGISRSVINHVGVHTDGVDLSWADPTVANPNSISLTDSFILVAQ